MEILENVRRSVIAGRMDQSREFVQEAMAANIPAQQILEEGLISAMAEVGHMFEAGEYFLPEMLVAARSMKTGLELLRPQLVAANARPVGRVVIGTVQGDLHDIGKNLVGMMLEGAGFEVIDLGADVAPEQYVQAASEYHPDIIACSALLTTTMVRMRDVSHSLEAAGLRGQVSLMIGGAPVTEDYAREIGADLYAPDAASAAARANELISGLKREKGSAF